MNKINPNIVIDRLITEDDQGHRYLILEPEGIKKKAASEFQHQFRRRNNTWDENNDRSEFWNNIYTPMNQHSTEMATLLEQITVEEWINNIKELNKKSAAGPSGIDYNIIARFAPHNSGLYEHSTII